MWSSVILATVTNETPGGAEEKDRGRPTRRLPRSRVSAAERSQMSQAVRDVDFPIALRGYDRTAVDRYVQQVNRVLAELEISSSPESAIRHALEEVSEETHGLLQRAHETAEEITARSRARADDRLQQAEHEADEVREAAAREAQETREAAQRETQALRERTAREAQELSETAQRLTQELRETTEREAHELTETAAREAQHIRATAEHEVEEMHASATARVRELNRNAEAIWRERQGLIENMSAVAQQLQGIADAEAARFPRPAEASTEEPPPTGEPAGQEELAAAHEPPTVPPEGAERI